MQILNEFYKAYAKINLHLQVLDRRNDGYHNILSLMARIDLFDLLKLEYAEAGKSPSGLYVSIKNGGGACAEVLDGLGEEENLVSLAVRKASERAGVTGRFQFVLEKNIPAGAGLGGGSADAAGALVLAAPLLGLDMPGLIGVSREVGADVPFLLHGGTAICEGTGDVIEPLDFDLKGSLLIVNNGIHVDTGHAYRMLNRDSRSPLSESETRIIKGKLRQAVADNDYEMLRQCAVNDFETVVCTEFPEIALLKDEVRQRGAEFALMTGSGSTVVGLFGRREAAEAAALSLKEDVAFVHVAEFV